MFSWLYINILDIKKKKQLILCSGSHSWKNFGDQCVFNTLVVLRDFYVLYRHLVLDAFGSTIYCYRESLWLCVCVCV